MSMRNQWSLGICWFHTSVNSGLFFVVLVHCMASYAVSLVNEMFAGSFFVFFTSDLLQKHASAKTPPMWFLQFCKGKYVFLIYFPNWQVLKKSQMVPSVSSVMVQLSKWNKCVHTFQIHTVTNSNSFQISVAYEKFLLSVSCIFLACCHKRQLNSYFSLLYNLKTTHELKNLNSV